MRRSGVVELDATHASDFEQTTDEDDESSRRLLEQLGPQHAAAYRAALGLSEDKVYTTGVRAIDIAADVGNPSKGNARMHGEVNSKIHIYEFRSRQNNA